MPSVAFYTLGCKLNQYETEAIREIFLSLNYKEVPYTQIADYYIINTCTVTAKTNRRSRQLVYQAHRRNPQAKIIITGCYAQIASEELQKIPGVSLIIGNNEKSQLIEYLESNTSNNIFVEDILQVKEYLPLQISQFTGYTRAFVKIQDGCDNFCTYCIVPYVRGPSRSRPLEDIVNEVKRLLDTGYREIVLVAVHLGTYGKDLQSSLTLIDVLENLLKLPKLVRLRLTSIEPTNFTDDLIDFIANEKDKICRHFHIPLQSGDKEILKRMRRPYTPSFYKDLLMRIANKIPDVSIGADVIIGFPSETEENFQYLDRGVNISFSVMGYAALSHIHVILNLHIVSFQQKYCSNATFLFATVLLHMGHVKGVRGQNVQSVKVDGILNILHIHIVCTC